MGCEVVGVATVSILSRITVVRVWVARAVELGGLKEDFAFGHEAQGVGCGGCTLRSWLSVSTALLISPGIMEAGSKGGSTLHALLLHTCTIEHDAHVAEVPHCSAPSSDDKMRMPRRPSSSLLDRPPGSRSLPPNPERWAAVGRLEHGVALEQQRSCKG